MTSGVLLWIATSGIVQGVIIGGVLAFLSATVIMNAVARTITQTVNGWQSVPVAGRPGNGVLVRAASAKALPVVNVFEEAAYWTTTKDNEGAALTGDHDYVLTFPPDGLPPSGAFWSLTATDLTGYQISNPVGRSSIDDRTALSPNPDGSIDVYLQRNVQPGHEDNWLPTPSGRFKLWLRSYLPGPAIVDGSYRVPPVVRAK